MNTIQTVLPVLGVVALYALLLVVIVRWVRRLCSATESALRGELAARGERIEVGPTSGLYGGGAGAYPRMSGNAVIALTDRKLYISRLVGAPIAIERTAIVGAREQSTFRYKYKGSPFVVVSLAGGDEVVFIVSDRAPWLAALPPEAVAPSSR